MEILLSKRLQVRKTEGLYRELTATGSPHTESRGCRPAKKGLIDFCSNDYLGLAYSGELRQRVQEEVSEHPDMRACGSTGSRLLSGNSSYAEHLESEIALFHHAEAGLIFNSGYAANLGVFSSIPGRGDTVICDEWVHASIIDGIRLSGANRYSFRHNDLDSLEEKLRAGRGNRIIAVESIYSMDGDIAPLNELVALAEEYNASLIIDEAHATGVIGKNGRGLVPALGLEDRVLARIYTFGKALGTHGAIVAGSGILRNYLINFARSFIYTTALPFHNLAQIKCAYEMLIRYPGLPELLFNKIDLYRGQFPGQTSSMPRTPIQTLLVPGNSNAKQAAAQLQQQGFDIRPILSPTVPAGSERLRISLHTFNTDENIVLLAKALKELERSK